MKSRIRMSSSTTKYLTLGIVIVLLIGLVYFFANNGRKGKFDWRETYSETSKQPFGSFVVHDILKSYFPAHSFNELQSKVAQSLPNPDSLKTVSNYVFLGDGWHLDTADTDKLLLFVQEGNNAFIAANVLPNYFLETTMADSCDNEYETPHLLHDWADSITLNLKHPQIAEKSPFTYIHIIQDSRTPMDWSYWDTTRSHCVSSSQDLTFLGQMNDDFINFIKFRYGKGTIYVHTNPLVFTNFYMIDSSKARYASKVLSHIPEGDIYWDTKSRIDRNVLRKMNGSNTQLNKEGPLKYVLEQPALRWAWFLFLALIALYLIFTAKRRQRTIPVLEDKSNTSLEFIQTIGNMYFQQGNHISLCDMMLKQFQTFVREKYHLASREMNEDFISHLALKSDIPTERIKRIVAYEDLIYRNSITEQSMVEFYHLLNNFYKTCK